VLQQREASMITIRPTTVTATGQSSNVKPWRCSANLTAALFMNTYIKYYSQVHCFSVACCLFEWVWFIGLELGIGHHSAARMPYINLRRLSQSLYELRATKELTQWLVGVFERMLVYRRYTPNGRVCAMGYDLVRPRHLHIHGIWHFLHVRYCRSCALKCFQTWIKVSKNSQFKRMTTPKKTSPADSK